MTSEKYLSKEVSTDNVYADNVYTFVVLEDEQQNHIMFGSSESSTAQLVQFVLLTRLPSLIQMTRQHHQKESIDLPSFVLSLEPTYHRQPILVIRSFEFTSSFHYFF